MAKTEEALRRRLVALDLAAKEVGLFPQTAKISIRKISDPQDELKSISIPPETSQVLARNQNAVLKRIRVLAKRGKPTDLTRFKYVLAMLTPTVKSNALLLKVLDNNPHLVDSVTRHWAHYAKIPKSLAHGLCERIEGSEIYHHVNAELLSLLLGRVDAAAEASLAQFAYERLFATRFRKKGIARPQTTYKMALLKWALLSGRMSFRDFDGALKGESNWWVRQAALRALDIGKFGPQSFAAILNDNLRADQPDVSRAAAGLIFATKATLRRPVDDVHLAGRLLLRAVGRTPRAGRPPSLINSVLAYVLKRPSTGYDWQRYFAGNHPSAEQMMLIAKQRFETDIDAFVVILDSFCDSIVRRMYERRGAQMPHYGTAVGAGAPGWLRAMPKLLKAFHDLHKLRIRSLTAHPRDLKTGAFNRRVTHAQYFRIRKALLEAFDEFETSVTP